MADAPPGPNPEEEEEKSLIQRLEERELARDPLTEEDRAMGYHPWLQEKCDLCKAVMQECVLYRCSRPLPMTTRCKWCGQTPCMLRQVPPPSLGMTLEGIERAIERCILPDGNHQYDDTSYGRRFAFYRESYFTYMAAIGQDIGERRVLPMCLVMYARRAYPAPMGDYTDYTGLWDEIEF